MDKVINDLLNTHYECPAGKGLHCTCKHAAAVLLTIEVLVEKDTLRTRKVLPTYKTSLY